ncbi:nitroreductase family protein [Fusobacterium russii]|uniref:nitroreductase family protein n=1 Tax=Fusobacterium russii TaxID=854 RepID=UPI00039E0398|nr:nitroreductase family protein [Fusobacterium russii]
MVFDLIKKSRTHRHFTDEPVTEETVLKILNAARYSSSAKNRQILRYAYTIDDEKCQQIFKNVSLGGALKKEEKPTIDERPRAFIAIVTDDCIQEDSSSLFFNMGIASQNIVLMANDSGLSSCIVMAYNKKEVDKILNLPENYSSKILILLGRGKEEVKVIDIHSNEDTKYYRENLTHCVPKIVLEDLIVSK